MEIEFINPSLLIPYAHNARKHPERQIKKLMSSIQEYGVVIPIFIDRNKTIIKGHAVTEAAVRLGVPSVPCVYVESFTEAQKRAYIIADNRLAEDSEWDEETLATEMLRLRDDFGIDLSITGFDAREILQLNLDSVEGLCPEDDVPPLDDFCVSKAGDIWRLGEHKIACGDSTNSEIVSALLGDVRPHLMVTDPPYGVEYNPAWRKGAGLSATKRTGRIMNDNRADWREAWKLFPGDVAYVWHGSLHSLVVAESLKACGFSLRSQIIWVKPNLVLSRGDIHWKHETCWYAVRDPSDKRECPELSGYCGSDYDACWYAVREGEISHWQGSRKISSVWEIDFKAQDERTTHGTQKPVECMRRAILNNSRVDEYVYEPFSGSGTTIIAAQTCRRKCLAVELNPAYVDMAVKRWQHFTSRNAVLESNGKPFRDVEQMRRE